VRTTVAPFGAVALHPGEDPLAQSIPPPETVPAPTSVTSPESPVEANESTRRMTLGRYVIEKKIGHGAMGAVYLGRDPDADRAVAIKTLALRQEFEGDALEEARKRFAREAQTAGRLNPERQQRRAAARRCTETCDYGPKVGSDGTVGREIERVALPLEQEGPVNSRCTKGYVIIGWARRCRAFSG